MISSDTWWETFERSINIKYHLLIIPMTMKSFCIWNAKTDGNYGKLILVFQQLHVAAYFQNTGSLTHTDTYDCTFIYGYNAEINDIF